MPIGTVSFRHFVLGLLTRQPMSGYDVKRFLKSLDWLIGNPSFGNLYPTLHALSDEGLVTVEVQGHPGRRTRKVYSITEEGRQVLAEWISQPARLETPLKAFLMRLILADAQSPTTLISHLQQRQILVSSRQAAVEEIISSGEGFLGLEQCLALDYGLDLARAEIAWLGQALNQLSLLAEWQPSTEVAKDDKEKQ